MYDAKKHLFRLIPLFTIFAIGISLSGCSDAFLPKVKTGSVKILKNAIEVEFTQLTREFGQLDLKGDLGLCDPVLFGVARFAVYQAVEEKRTATMAQLTRFIMRARAAIRRAKEKMQKKQCIDQDGDGLTDITEYRKYKTKLTMPIQMEIKFPMPWKYAGTEPTRSKRIRMVTFLTMEMKYYAA